MKIKKLVCTMLGVILVTGARGDGKSTFVGKVLFLFEEPGKSFNL